MRPYLPAMLVVGLCLAGCGRDADSVSPAQSDPRMADPAAEGTTMDMGTDPGTSASVATSPGNMTGVAGGTPGGAVNATRQNQVMNATGGGTGSGSTYGSTGTRTSIPDTDVVSPQDTPTGTPPR